MAPDPAPRSLTVATLNVNGLRSADRRGFRDWLARRRPDVLCLQEVRAELTDLDAGLRAPEGYAVCFTPAVKKGYAGTAVWVREGLGAAFDRGSGHTRGDEEGRLTGARVGPFEVWSLYLPSGSSGPERQAWKNEFMDHIRPWFDGRRARPALVCGDLNIAHEPIDLKNWRSNQKNSGFLPEERAWFGELLRSGWRDSFREHNPGVAAYSWWSARGRARENDVGWRIDYVLATADVPVREAWIEKDAGLSDHAPVWVRLELP